MAVLSVVMLAGALLDAWAHVHVPTALETILTPWHFVVYASFAALGLFLAAPVVARLVRGRSLRTAYPRSYGWALVGGGVFVAAGGLDLAWHLAFGIELGVEALLSPTHLALAVGAGLLWSGPITTAWRRSVEAPALQRMLPALLAMSALVGLVAFTTHFAHPLVDPWPAYRFSERDPGSWYVPSLGFASIVIQIGVLVGAALLLLRRWPGLPTGALTLIFAVSSAGLPFLHDSPELLAAPLIWGVAADILLAVLRGGLRDSTRVARAMSVLLPLAMGVVYLVVVELAYGVAWSAHLVAGSIVMCTVTGFLVGMLVFSPRRPRHSRADQ